MNAASEQQFIAEVMRELYERKSEWVCAYCGASAEDAPDPSMFACCGEVGHIVLVDSETGKEI